MPPPTPSDNGPSDWNSRFGALLSDGGETAPWVNRRLLNSPETDLIAYFPKGSRVYCYSYVFKVVPCSMLHVLYDFSAVIAIRRMNGVSLRLSIRQAFDPERTRVASLDLWQARLNRALNG
jgi:hypothetical protein